MEDLPLCNCMRVDSLSDDPPFFRIEAIPVIIITTPSGTKVSAIHFLSDKGEIDLIKRIGSCLC